MARIKKNFAGSYSILRPDGTVVATIENGDVAELDDRREWLVTYYRHETGVGWVVFDGDTFPTKRMAKEYAMNYAKTLMTTTAGY